MKMEPEGVSIPQLAEARIYKFDKSYNGIEVSASVLDAEKVKITSNTNIFQSEVSHSEEATSGELLKELLTDAYCHVCHAVLQFESQRVSHYEGKKHAQKVRLYLQSKNDEEKSSGAQVIFQRDGSVGRERFCELCNMVFSSPVVAKSHYEGKIHAKNLRRHGLSLPTSEQTENCTLQDNTEAPVGTTATQEARREQMPDLGNPDEYCHLCSASFNKPEIAKLHYAGRRHKRNQGRQCLLRQMGADEESGIRNTGSFTCPVCCVTMMSVEMCQAHMQGSKHQLKEMEVSSLISKSQRKVYRSFQDELADYIQVQKVRGLEPRTTQKEKKQGRGAPVDGAADIDCEANIHPSTPFPASPWYPSYLHPPQMLGLPLRGPEGSSWNPVCTLPGSLGRHYQRGSSNGYNPGQDGSLKPESADASYMSSSSSSHSYGQKEKKGLNRRVGGEGRGREEWDSGKEEEEESRWRKKRHRKKSRGDREGRKDEEHRAKRGREKSMNGDKDGDEQQVKVLEPEQEGAKEGKTRHKKDKRAKERRDEIDSRTEEEKLWDESILGQLCSTAESSSL